MQQQQPVVAAALLLSNSIAGDLQSGVQVS
jgi:hypothetical protein